MNTNKKDVNILDLLAALNANKRLIVVSTLLLSAVALAFSFLLPKEYEATVQLLPPKDQKKGFGFADLIGSLPIPSLRLGEKGTPADIFVAVLQSEQVRRTMIEEFDLMQVYETKTMTDALETIEGQTTISKSEQGTIIITVLDESPQRAAAMTNRYVALLDTTNKRFARNTAKERYDFIRKLKGKEEIKLEEEMDRLQQFQADHNAISLEDQARAVIRAAADMQTSTMELEIQRLSLLAAGFTPDHSEVKKIERESILWQQALGILRDGQKKTDETITTVPADLELKLKENLFLPLREIPQVAQEYALIEKDVAVQSALIRMLLQQEAESLIESNNTTSTVQVLDEAMVPEKKARPRRLLISFVAGIISFFFTVFYTLGSVYLRALKERWEADYSGRDQPRQ